MIKLLRKFRILLDSPYPEQAASWKAVVVPACIVFLILFLLQPFGLSRMDSGQWLAAAGSAVIAAVGSAVFNYLLPALFPRYYARDRWTVGKYIVNLLGLLFLIAVGVCCWVARLTGNGLGWRLFFYSVLWVFILAPFPTVLFVMWDNNLRLKRNLQEALALNDALARKAAPAQSVKPADEDSKTAVLLFQSTTKESLQVPTADFLYAESDGNYVRVVYRMNSNGKPAQRLLRLTMRQAEEAVAACPSVVRCHRAFLVNLRQVVRIDGNSQGYRLRLTGCNAEIPVSRSYAKLLREHLTT